MFRPGANVRRRTIWRVMDRINKYIWQPSRRKSPSRSTQREFTETPMRKHIVIFSAIGLPLLLAACGGASTSGNTTAEGAWIGTDSWNNTFNMLVLDNGDYYSLYGSTNKAGDFLLQGFDQGAPNLNGTALQGSITEYDSTNKPVQGALDATLMPGKSLKGTITNEAGNAAGTFIARPLSARHTHYDYNTSASLSDVAYSWTVTSLNGGADQIAISAKGAVTGSINGCSFSGTVSPRGKGKNVLNMGLRFGSGPCANANQVVSGIALDYDLGNGKWQLLAALQDPKKTYAYSFSAQR